MARACSIWAWESWGPTADITSIGQARVDTANHWSTRFLMAMPYAIVGSIGGYLAYLYQRAERRPEEGTQDRGS
jgi:hypothetical protein